MPSAQMAPRGNGAVGPGRVPPHDSDAERSLLGGLLLDNKSLRAVAELLQPADFYREAHRKVYAAMLALDEDHEPVDRVTLSARLSEEGALESVGGEPFIDLLDTTVPSAANLLYYATIIHGKSLSRRLIEAAHAIASQGYEQVGSVAELLDDAERRIRAVTGRSDERTNLLSDALVLSPSLIRAEPPPHAYLLRRAEDGVGVVVMGQVGMLAARGGTGKSFSLSQLGVAIATGTTWFGEGHGWRARQGRGLLIMAEEDADESRRRIHNSCKAAGLISDEVLAEVAQNLLVLPRRGRSVALMTVENLSRGLPRSRFAIDLYDLLVEANQSGNPFVWVGLDPLSRFAGPDVETDNAAATRFVQVVETLTAPECGAPAVLVAHHNRKPSKSDVEGADSVRGSSALVDGVRWVAQLERVKTREGREMLYRLTVTKSNYSQEAPPLILSRVPDCHGALAVAKDVVEREENVPEVESISPAIIEKVFAKIPITGEGASKGYIVNVAGVNRQAGLKAIDLLVDGGKVEKAGRGKYVRSKVPNGSQQQIQNLGLLGSQTPPLPLKGEGSGGTKVQADGTKERVGTKLEGEAQR